MKAAVVRRYGPPEVAQITEVDTPTLRPRTVLLRVEAAAVTSGDARIRGSRFPAGMGILARLGLGIRGPRQPVLGVAVSGVVTAVGPDVTKFAVGDEVTGMTGGRMGAHAQFALARESGLTLKPATVSYVDAAGVMFGGTTALHFLRRTGVQAGSRVLVLGASGSVGARVVQLAQHLGAVVTATTSSRNTEFVANLGAATVVDYASTSLDSLPHDFDVVIDTVGAASREQALSLAGDSGRVALVAAGLMDTVRARGRVVAGPAAERSEDMAELLGLLESGKLQATTEVVGGLTALPEAYRRVDSGRKVGNLVIQPNAA